MKSRKIIANDTRWGLGGFVYTRDLERALRANKRIQAGNISVNSITYVRPEDPCVQSSPAILRHSPRTTVCHFFNV
jgi:acyl-CoA reductase-like NAD-dependent aldehyde dehydrogenase